MWKSTEICDETLNVVLKFFYEHTVTCGDSARRFYYTFELAFEVSGNFLGSYTLHDTSTRPSNENCKIAVWPSDSIQRDSLRVHAHTVRITLKGKKKNAIRSYLRILGERELLQRCIKADEIGCSLSLPRTLPAGRHPKLRPKDLGRRPTEEESLHDDSRMR